MGELELDLRVPLPAAILPHGSSVQRRGRGRKPDLQATLAQLALKESRSISRSLLLHGDRDRCVHEARRAIRRLRGLLALVDQVGGQIDGVDDALKSLAYGLSGLRDVHVVIGSVEKLGRRHKKVWRRIIDRLGKQRDALFDAALQQDPLFRMRRKQAAAITRTIGQFAWTELTSEGMRESLASSVNSLVEARLKVHKHATEKAMHRWRRKARRLKLQLDALRRLPIPPGMLALELEAIPEAGMAKLEHLVHHLGWRQDLVVLDVALKLCPVSAERKELKHAIRKETRAIDKKLRDV